MKQLLVTLVANAIGLWISVELIDGFELAGGAVSLLLTAAVFTLINLTVRPIVKLLFGPVILLTLGLFVIVINAGMLWLLDALIDALAIGGLGTLLLGTLVIGFVNLIFSPIKSHND
jgi:putative membrane protein